MTHTRKNKTVTEIETGATKRFKSINEAKRYMRSLPQHHNGQHKKR